MQLVRRRLGRIDFPPMRTHYREHIHTVPPGSPVSYFLSSIPGPRLPQRIPFWAKSNLLFQHTTINLILNQKQLCGGLYLFPVVCPHQGEGGSILSSNSHMTTIHTNDVCEGYCEGAQFCLHIHLLNTKFLFPTLMTRNTVLRSLLQVIMVKGNVYSITYFHKIVSSWCVHVDKHFSYYFGLVICCRRNQLVFVLFFFNGGRRADRQTHSEAAILGFPERPMDFSLSKYI